MRWTPIRELSQKFVRIFINVKKKRRKKDLKGSAGLYIQVYLQYYIILLREFILKMTLKVSADPFQEYQ